MASGKLTQITLLSNNILLQHAFFAKNMISDSDDELCVLTLLGLQGAPAARALITSDYVVNVMYLPPADHLRPLQFPGPLRSEERLHQIRLLGSAACLPHQYIFCAVDELQPLVSFKQAERQDSQQLRSGSGGLE